MKETKKTKQKLNRRELSQYWQQFNHPRKGQCCTVGPIKDLDDIKKLKEYLFKKSARDYLLFILAINNGLRTGDLLKLKVSDLKDLKPGESLRVKESKTKKTNLIYVNQSVYDALQNYLKKGKHTEPDNFLFPSQIHPTQAITTIGVNLMLKSWTQKLNIKGNFGSHSLRKSWAYHQRVSHGTAIELIMQRLNHSSIQMTLRYATIDECEINHILENEI